MLLFENYDWTEIFFECTYYSFYFFLVGTLKQRQSVLYHSIGYFEAEEMSYYNSIYLLSGSAVYLIVGNAIAWFSFSKYNEGSHPFANILKTKHGRYLKALSFYFLRDMSDNCQKNVKFWQFNFINSTSDVNLTNKR